MFNYTFIPINNVYILFMILLFYGHMNDVIIIILISDLKTFS